MTLKALNLRKQRKDTGRSQSVERNIEESQINCSLSTPSSTMKKNKNT